jgi:hypothetical protein
LLDKTFKLTKQNFIKYVLFMIIPFSIIIDLFNGYFQIVLGYDFSIGVMYRGLIFLLLLGFLFTSKQGLKYYIVSLIFFFVLSLFIWSLTQQYFSPMVEIKFFIRLLYQYVILSFLLAFSDLINFYYIFKLIVIFGLIGGLSIIFSYLTGIGLETYGDYAFGIKSFFNAQNDISLALLLSLNLTIYMLNIVKEKSFYVISALVVSIGLLLLGTRAGMIGVAIVWLLNILGLLVLKDENMRIKLTFKVIISIFSFFVIGVFLYYTYQLMTEYSYMLEKFNFEDKSIFGVRGILIQAAIVRIENFNLLEILFGYGNDYRKKNFLKF